MLGLDHNNLAAVIDAVPLLPFPFSRTFTYFISRFWGQNAQGFKPFKEPLPYFSLFEGQYAMYFRGRMQRSQICDFYHIVL